MTFQKATGGDRMLQVEEAQRRILDEIAVLGTDAVGFLHSVGRVLREDVVAIADAPAADNSAMDGYAVRAADVANATAEAPVSLRVIGDVPAGTIPDRSVESGTAIRIMTGAFVPEGSDAVVQVELTDAGSESVRIFKPVARGANIRRRGEDLAAGSVVLRSGTVIGPAELALLASLQKLTVRVGRRPTVAIISTGDELIDVHEERTPGKIVGTNGYALAALVRDAGGEPTIIGNVRDDRNATIAAFESAAGSDFIVSSGGVSVGAYDFVKSALDELGAETRFWQIAMKPGKPVVLSILRGRPCFGLPGNPVSCAVAFHLFVAPAIRKAAGQRDDLFPASVTARVTTPLKAAGDRRVYFRGRLASRGGELVASPLSSQGSGSLSSIVGANCLIVVERGSAVAAGDLVQALVIGTIGSE